MKIGLLFSLFLLISCDTEFVGMFQANQDISFSDGTVIQAGRYESDFEIKSKSKAELDIVVDGQKIEFPLTIPGWLDLNEVSDFELTAAEISQPFNMSGLIVRTTEQGPVEYRTQSCQRRIAYQHCWTNSKGQTYCEIRYRIISGWQRNQVRVITNKIQNDFDFIAPENGEVVASFTGSQNKSVEEVLFYGECRINGYP